MEIYGSPVVIIYMELITFFIIGITSRLVPHPANVTAIGATALFFGAKYGIKKGVFITFLTMIVTDFFLGMHPVMWATYGSLALAVFIGSRMQSKTNGIRIIIGTLGSSVIFFLITNFAVWLVPNGMYAKTMSGLIECYVMALPFFRNSLFGDLWYSGIFFGGWELIQVLKHTRNTRIVQNVNNES